MTTFGERAEAEATIAKVRGVHERVCGVLEDGTPYHASEPRLLAWVHVCEALGFLAAWIAFGELGMSRADQDTYFAEAGEVARALGADPIPQTRAEAKALVETFRPELVVNARSHEVARMVLRQPATSLAMAPVQALLMQAAVDILPGWAREMHSLRASTLTGLIIRGGALGVASTLRWAFESARRPI